MSDKIDKAVEKLFSEGLSIDDVVPNPTGEMDEQEWADHMIGLVVNACMNKIPGVDVWHYDDGMLKINCSRGSVILKVSNIHRRGGR